MTRAVEESYQKLAAEVRAAGGQVELAPGELAARLDRPMDVRDVYVQYAVRRNLKAAGITATFGADGSVSVAAVPEADSPVLAEPNAQDSAQAVFAATKPTPSASENHAQDTRREPPQPSLPETSAEQPTATALTAKQAGSGLYALLYFVSTFFPAIAHQLLPGGEVGEKQDAFFAIYFATVPLSLAATFIFLMLFFKWFENDNQRLGAACVAIVVSAVWGIGFGQSYADLHSISQLQGPPLVRVAEVVVLAIGAYVIYYGWALFIAGVLTSFLAALWLKEKATEMQLPVS